MNTYLVLFVGLGGIMMMFVAIIVAQEFWLRYKRNKMMRAVDPHWGKYDPDEVDRWRQIGRAWPTRELELANQAEVSDGRGSVWTHYTFVPIHPNSPSLKQYIDPKQPLADLLEDKYLSHGMLRRANKCEKKLDYWSYYLGEA